MCVKQCSMGNILEAGHAFPRITVEWNEREEPVHFEVCRCRPLFNTNTIRFIIYRAQKPIGFCCVLFRSRPKPHQACSLATFDIGGMVHVWAGVRAAGGHIKHGKTIPGTVYNKPPRQRRNSRTVYERASTHIEANHLSPHPTDSPTAVSPVAG